MDEQGIPMVGILVGAISAAIGLFGLARTSVPLWITVTTVLAGVLVIAFFSARRHGWLPRDLGAIGAAFGGLVLLGSASAILATPASVAVWYITVITGGGVAAFVLAVADFQRIPSTDVASAVRAISVGVLLMIGGFLVAGFLLAIPQVLGVEFSPVADSAFQQLALGIAFVSTTIGFLLGTDRQLGYLDIERPDRRGLVWIVGGIVGVIGAAIVIGVIFTWFGIDGAEHELSRRAREEGAILLLVGMPLTLFVTAVGEEMLYRNGIQKYLTERFHSSIAIVLTSVMFAGAHVTAFSDVDIMALLASLSLIFVLSVLIGYIYERTRNVVIPILIHGCYNVFVYGIWYLDIVG